MKGIEKKPTANIILNGKRFNTFPLRSETKQVCSLSSLQCNIVLEVPASEIRQGKKLKGTQIWKEEMKLFIYRWYNCPYRKSSEGTKKASRIYVSLANLHYTRSICENQFYLYILAKSNVTLKF